MLRRRLKLEIVNLQNGIEPRRPSAAPDASVPTVGGDTILRIPRQDDDAALIGDVCARIVAAYRESEHLPDEARREAIGRRLAPLNQGDATEVNPDRGKVFEFKTVA
jgi:hypothetical protein